MMLPASKQRLVATLPPDAVVLDVGGWADPLDRADWVLDQMPYETRGMYEREGWVERRSHDDERFDAATWVQRDVCDRMPYPFEDDSIDFVVCSHTLEDLRDPLWVCSEMNRVARAGYVEVPSRLEEQSWGVQGPYVGWPHHRWLIDPCGGGLEFTMKLHSIHSRSDQHFPPGFWPRLSAEERVVMLWWEGDFSYRERVLLDAEASDAYLGAFVARELAVRGLEGPQQAPMARVRGALGRLLRR